MQACGGLDGCDTSSLLTLPIDRSNVPKRGGGGWVRQSCGTVW